MATALLLGIVAGCSTAPPEHPPEVVTLSSQDTIIAEPEPITTPLPSTGPGSCSRTPCYPPPPSNHFNFNPRNLGFLDRWSLSNGFGLPRRLSANPEPAYSFASAHGHAMSIRVGSQVAWWNGLEFYLGFAPVLIDGHFPSILSTSERTSCPCSTTPSISQPTASSSSTPVSRGGADACTTNVINGHFEKEYTLDLARRLQPLLACNGGSGWLARTNDVKLALSNRVAFAEQHKAAFS